MFLKGRADVGQLHIGIRIELQRRARPSTELVVEFVGLAVRGNDKEPVFRAGLYCSGQCP